MSNEFRPIESAPAKPAWPWAVGGAVVAALGMWLLHRTPAAPAPQQKPVALANIPAAESPKAPEIAPLTQPKPAAEPNMLGAAAQAVTKVAMVAKSELDRELGRTQSARREAASYKAQVAELNKQLADARAQLAAMRAAKQPQPPSDREQILQMLAPVLKAQNDGHP